MMQATLDDLPRPLGHVVHIGAGTGTELLAYLAAGAMAVLLVEADTDTADRLGVLSADHPEVTVIEAAVSADSRRRPFRRMNFQDLNSFRNPTGLKELFPGLRILSEDPVRPGDPVGLIEPLDLSGDHANILVIEAPGESLGILKALSAAGVLTRFDVIRVQEGRETLYDRAPVAGEVRDLLADEGFTTSFEATPEDPERPYLLGHLDRALLEAEQHRGEMAGVLETVQGQSQKIKALSAARDAAEQAAGNLRDALAEAQQNLFVSLRMQALRDSDLKDLQQRYASLLQSKDAQDELLQRLTASLGNAAQYLLSMDDAPVGKNPAKPRHRKKSPPGKAKTVIATDE